MIKIKVSVTFFGSDKKEEVELENKYRVIDVFEKLNIPIETHIVQKDGFVITETEELSDNDNLMFIRVASGG